MHGWLVSTLKLFFFDLQEKCNKQHLQIKFKITKSFYKSEGDKHNLKTTLGKKIEKIIKLMSKQKKKMQRTIMKKIEKSKRLLYEGKKKKKQQTTLAKKIEKS